MTTESAQVITSERLFIAIGFEPDLCQKLEKDVKKVKVNLDRAELGFKWVPASNYHVTLVFLGETEAAKKEKICAALEDVSRDIQPFELQISGVDAFSSEHEARLIYCGVQNKRDLRALVALIRQRLGLPQDENYSPHLTLARLRNPAHVKDIISPVRRKDFFKLKVNEIRLYRSLLTGPYPQYQSLRSFQFRPDSIFLSPPGADEGTSSEG
jgi:2'-5' RNA ligase